MGPVARRAVAIAGVAGALALVGALTLWRRPALAPASPSSSSQPNAANPVADIRTPSANAVFNGETPVEAAPVTEARTALAARSAPTGPPLEVYVVAKESGAPVAGADVVVAECAGDAWMHLGMLADPEAFESTFGTPTARARTDANGRAMLGPINAFTAVLARTEQAWGFRFANAAESSRAWLDIVTDGALQVEVVDPDGRPVERVGVQLRDWNRDNRVASAPTASDGIARFPHAGHHLRRSSGVTEWRAVLEIVDLEQPNAPFDLANLPSGPLRLVAPPLGEVEVELTDLDGQPYSGSASVHFRVASALGKGTPESIRFDTSALVIGSDGGHCSTRSVALGLELEASAVFHPDSALVTVRFAGPRTPTDRVLVQIQRGGGKVVAEIRALDDRREPLRRCALRAEIVGGASGGASYSSHGVTTNDEGIFQWILEPHSTADGGVLHRVVNPASGAFAPVDIPAGLPPGRHVLGDIVLAGEPVLVAGTVRNDAGEPLPGAAVIVFGRESALPIPWTSHARADADAQGQFEIHGSRDDPTPLTVGAMHAGHACASEVVAPGASDVVLVLPRAGEVRGAVRDDDGSPITGLRVDALLGGVCVGLDPDLSELGLGTSVLVRADGRFALERLAPGTYDVRFVHAGSGTPLVEVSGVVVRAGEVTRDPRLDDIDLGGAGRTVIVRVTDAVGELVRGASIRWRPARNPDGWREVWPFDGVARIAIEGDALDVIAAAEGYGRVRIDDVREDRVIVLPPALRARLVLPADFFRPEPPTYLQARLIAADGEDQTWAWARPRVGSEGEVVVLAPIAGRHRIEWEVVRDDGAKSDRRAIVEESQPGHIELAPGSGEQVFDVRIDADALKRALAELED